MLTEKSLFLFGNFLADESCSAEVVFKFRILVQRLVNRISKCDIVVTSVCTRSDQRL